jgi:hypothetical protein
MHPATRAKEPVIVGLVLHHRAKCHQPRMRGEARDLICGVRRRKRRPADDPRNERSRVGQVQQKTSLGHRRCGLHEDRRADASACDDRRKIGGRKSR